MRGQLCPRIGRMDLEHELQPKLHYAGASRTDDRATSYVVGCAPRRAERGRGRGINSAVSRTTIRCAVRIGDDGAVEQIEDFNPELGAEPLADRESLEDREIHAPEALVAEDVPAHGAKRSSYGRNHDRVAGHEAATRRERSGI